MQSFYDLYYKARDVPRRSGDPLRGRGVEHAPGSSFSLGRRGPLMVPHAASPANAIRQQSQKKKRTRDGSNQIAFSLSSHYTHMRISGSHHKIWVFKRNNL
jgi:hypothetical protein